MRASFYRGNRTFETGEAPLPAPGAGEALLRVRRVGICGSDLRIFQGHLDHRVPKNGIIGHEVFAEIVSAPDASGFAAGDRVTVMPVLSCGHCRACLMGASYLCYKLKVLGVDWKVDAIVDPTAASRTAPQSPARPAPTTEKAPSGRAAADHPAPALPCRTGRRGHLPGGVGAHRRRTARRRAGALDEPRRQRQAGGHRARRRCDGLRVPGGARGGGRVGR